MSATKVTLSNVATEISRVLAAAHAWAHRSTFADPIIGAQVAWELLVRLQQLRWLIDEIHRCEEAYWRRHRAEVRKNPNLIRFHICSAIPSAMPEFAAEDVMRLHAENFYWVAHRLLVIVSQCRELHALPPVEAPAIRRVRNNLIEHANKPGGRHAYSFSVSTAAGVRLRGAAPVEDRQDAYPDEGIAANGMELATALYALFADLERAAHRDATANETEPEK